LLSNFIGLRAELLWSVASTYHSHLPLWRATHNCDLNIRV